MSHSEIKQVVQTTDQLHNLSETTIQDFYEEQWI
jgi:hypothetical protein